VTEADEVPLAEAAGRILLADVVSPLDLPEAGIRNGEAALATGRRLSPQDIWLAAALGRQSLTVSRPLKVALFSTGDELAELGQELGAGQIYDSNRRTLGALLQQLGIAYSDLGILADRPETVRGALAEAAADHDAVMTSGGVSTGDEDHVKAAVEALGSLHFWRLAIKPGRPVALGQFAVGDRRLAFIGLPGNPVAAWSPSCGSPGRSCSASWGRARSSRRITASVPISSIARSRIGANLRGGAWSGRKMASWRRSSFRAKARGF
jgi:molybdenum cofactor synthesis domain-containing protein